MSKSKDSNTLLEIADEETENSEGSIFRRSLDQLYVTYGDSRILLDGQVARFSRPGSYSYDRSIRLHHAHIELVKLANHEPWSIAIKQELFLETSSHVFVDDSIFQETLSPNGLGSFGSGVSSKMDHMLTQKLAGSSLMSSYGDVSMSELQSLRPRFYIKTRSAAGRDLPGRKESRNMLCIDAAMFGMHEFLDVSHLEPLFGLFGDSLSEFVVSNSDRELYRQLQFSDLYIGSRSAGLPLSSDMVQTLVRGELSCQRNPYLTSSWRFGDFLDAKLPLRGFGINRPDDWSDDRWNDYLRAVLRNAFTA